MYVASVTAPLLDTGARATVWPASGPCLADLGVPEQGGGWRTLGEDNDTCMHHVHSLTSLPGHKAGVACATHACDAAAYPVQSQHMTEVEQPQAHSMVLDSSIHKLDAGVRFIGPASTEC